LLQKGERPVFAKQTILNESIFYDIQNPVYFLHTKEASSNALYMSRKKTWAATCATTSM
jgi:hypothetical protein